MTTNDFADRFFRDLRETTDLAIRWELSSDGTLEVWDEAGRRSWAAAAGPSLRDPASLGSVLQSEYVIERLGQAWPRCICHGRHPMVASSDDGGVWVCPTDPNCRVSIGELTLSGVEELDVEDGRVRWFRPEWGWGVIAHSDGDLFVHFSAIEVDGFKTLAEDQPVEYSVEDVPQGAFTRRAARVTPVS